MFSKIPFFRSSRDAINADCGVSTHRPQMLETNQQAELTRIPKGADRDAQEGGRE